MFESRFVLHKEKPKAPFWVRVLAWIVLGILYFPLLVLILYSFLHREVSGEWSWSFRWYSEALADPSLMSAFGRSLWIGLWSALGSCVLGTACALALERSQFPGKRFFDGFTLVPCVVPEIVMGISLLIWFVALQVTLGVFSIILAHITFCLAYVIVTVRARLKDFDFSLEEAAQDLGASRWKTFWKITFPLITPGVLAGALMAFTLSFDDFIVTFFTTGVGSDTLPIKLYSMIKFGVSPKVNALSTLIFLVTVACIMLLFWPKKIPKSLGKQHESH